MNPLLLTSMAATSTSVGGYCAVLLQRRVHILMAFGAGVLIGAACLDLLPSAAYWFSILEKQPLIIPLRAKPAAQVEESALLFLSCIAHLTEARSSLHPPFPCKWA